MNHFPPRGDSNLCRFANLIFTSIFSHKDLNSFIFVFFRPLCTHVHSLPTFTSFTSLSFWSIISNESSCFLTSSCFREIFSFIFLSSSIFFQFLSSCSFPSCSSSPSLNANPEEFRKFLGLLEH